MTLSEGTIGSQRLMSQAHFESCPAMCICLSVCHLSASRMGGRPEDQDFLCHQGLFLFVLFHQQLQERAIFGDQDTFSELKKQSPHDGLVLSSSNSTLSLV